MAKEATAQDLIGAGLSKSFAHHVMAGSRQLSVPLALWLHDERGIVAPPLNGRTKREIDVLRGIFEPRPPQHLNRSGHAA